MTRRLTLLLVVCTAWPQEPHFFGPMPPTVVPDLRVELHTGAPVQLGSLLRGKISAVQFVFTDCPTACPLLGRLFANVERRFSDDRAQLVTVTVSPERDTPARLDAWLRSHRAGQRWVGVRVDPVQLPRLLRAFGLSAGAPERHTLQVFLVDRQVRLIARTSALPTAETILAAMEQRTVRGPISGGEPVALRGNGREIYEGAAGCSGCHGANRAGRREGELPVPALLPASLTTTQPRRGGPASRYTQEAFCASLRTGIDPAGVQYSPVMPRYPLDGASCSSLWQFLTRDSLRGR